MGYDTGQRSWYVRLILYGENMAGEAAEQGMSWTHADPGYVPPEIDTSRPSVAAHSSESFSIRGISL